ncbi:MAG TPA: NAD(P)/FAD-dependent oxidoreductase [Desulfatiglandales bacterium]|nr:NAD(P)/FAD-dependent oxidoreductase [Desulfatiglandales bacterium]
MSKDIAIIGGSAAGFLTASLLARKGLRVRVFEKSERIGHSPRTLIVTGHMLDLLEPLCNSTVINRINRFELFTDGRSATIYLKKPDLVLERTTLIQTLTKMAETNGAEILSGHRFLSLKPNGKSLAFAVSQNGYNGTTEESADILVGADGAFSKVAKSAGLPKQTTVPIIQATVKLPGDMLSDSTRIWFVPEHTPYFYWLIPFSSTRGVLGLIGEEGQEIKGRLESFLEDKGMEPMEFQEAQVPKYTRWVSNHRKIGKGHVYLVGDAAGHVKVSTVGGIVTGLQGAHGVAEAILNGGSSRKFRLLRRELDRHRLIRRVLCGLNQKDYATLLDLLTPAIRLSLGVFTRDETSKLLLNVMLKQPRLLLLGLRALLIGR